MKNLSVSRRVETAVTVGNIIELTHAIIHEIAGNDISSQLNGSPITREAVGQLVLSKINAKYKHLQG